MDILGMSLDDFFLQSYTEHMEDRTMEHQIGRIRNIDSVLRFIKENGIQGDIIEFGVYQGVSLIWMARLRKKQNLMDRRIIGVDCFKGLPRSSGIWKKGAFQDTSREMVECNIDKYLSSDEKNGIHIIEGLFDDERVNKEIKNISDSFSLYHIDCDLGSSSDDALKLVEGHRGAIKFILFDDWYVSEREVPDSFRRWKERNPSIRTTIFSETNITRYYKIEF